MSDIVELDKLTAESFQPHTDSLFALNLADSEIIPLTLVSVTQTDYQTANCRQAFSLTFTGPREPILPQRIYPLYSESMGNLEIFLVPIGLTPEHCRYEAVFN